jgi:hypothetical protein
MGLLLLMGNSGASFTGALDSLGSGLESAWSMARRVRSAYASTSPIVRVRRSSDGAQQDFGGSGATGAVDSAAVAAFCGAGDGFLVTVYDQSGNGRNFTESTEARQPIVCESGVAVTEGGRLAAKYVASTIHRMTVATSTTLYNFLHTTGGSLAVVSKANDTAAGKTILNTNNGATASAGFNFTRDASERVFWQSTRLTGPASGSSVTDTSTNGSAAHTILTLTVDPDNATAADRLFGWQNGTALTGFVNASTGTPNVENAANDLTMGVYPNVTTSPFDGTIQEIFIYSEILSTANRRSIEANQGTFYGITVS